MSARHVLGAVLVCALGALGAPPARAAESDLPTVRARESMSQSLVISGSPAKPAFITIQTRSLRASFDLPTDPTVTVALTESSPVSLRLGSLEFDAVLGDDPAWTPFRQSATFTLPPPADAPQGTPGSTLKLRWTASRISARLRGSAAALLRHISPAEGSTRIAMQAEASLTVGDGSWFFLGTASGRALVRARSFRGDEPEVARARVTYLGQAADANADRTAPFVHIDLPAADSIELATPIRVKGTAGDDRGVAHLFWSMSAGAETEAAFTADSSGGGFGGEFGTFEFDAPVPGEGTWTLRVRAVDVGGNSTIHEVPFVHRFLKSTALATGGDTSFVVQSGVTFAWGADDAGQLGDGPFGARITPEEVAILGSPIAISASASHTVMLRADGTVWCCGANESGQLGDGSRTGANAPVRVAGLTNALSVAAGSTHSIALRSDGTVWCWGANTHGECGENAIGADSPTPVEVPGLTTATAVAAGDGTSLAILFDGTVRTWGDGTYGVLGNDPRSSATPRTVGDGMPGGGFRDVVEIAVGTAHALARKSDGTVWGWGLADYGALGIGDPGALGSHFAFVPVQVKDVSGATSICASAYASAAILANRTVVAWGDNTWGEIGDGTTVRRTSAVAVKGLTSVARLASGHASRHVLAVRDDDTISGWGSYTTGTPIRYDAPGNPWHFVPLRIGF